MTSTRNEKQKTPVHSDIPPWEYIRKSLASKLKHLDEIDTLLKKNTNNQTYFYINELLLLCIRKLDI
jgi:hypothetical protein